MSSDHIKVKHKILEKDKFEFETLIDRMMLSEEEQQMMMVLTWIMILECAIAQMK